LLKRNPNMYLQQTSILVKNAKYRIIETYNAYDLAGKRTYTIQKKYGIKGYRNIYPKYETNKIVSALQKFEALAQEMKFKKAIKVS